MERMRIALTVLPVGPRSKNVLDDNEQLWFALQIVAGFKTDVSSDEIAKLWPWVLHVVTQDEVALNGWLTKSDGTVTTINVGAAVAHSGGGFVTKLRDEVAAIYYAKRADVDLRLYLPKELASVSEADLQRNFPSRLSYLTSLPGELSRCLLATLYLQIDRDALYVKVNDEWQPRDGAKRLWLAPREIQRDGIRAPSGSPQRSSEHPSLYHQEFEGDIDLFGPGYELTRFQLKPGDQDASLLFDLGKFWLPVSSGDSRFWDLEGFLLQVVDPFVETAQITVFQLEEALTTESGRSLSSEEVTAARDLWRVQVLADALRWAADEDQRLLGKAAVAALQQLGHGAEATKILRAIPDAFKAKLDGDLLQQAEDLAKVLNIGLDTRRTMLAGVAQRSERGTLTRWLVGALDAAIDAVGSSDLRDAWRFEDDEEQLGERRRAFAQVIERRHAFAQVIMTDELIERWVRPLLDDLDQVTTDLVKHLRGEGGQDGEVIKQILQRWGQRIGQDVAAALNILDPNSSVGDALKLEASLRRDLARAQVDERWPHDERRRETAGRPMALVFGDAAHRVVHRDNKSLSGQVAGGDGGIFNEVTGHILLVRRHHNPDQLPIQPWRLISSGIAARGRPEGEIFVPADDMPDDWLPELLAIAEENVFVDNLLRSDRGYEGEMRHIQSALELVYETGEVPPGEGVTAAFSYQGLGSYEGNNADMVQARELAKAPALRYGDAYQFAAGLVDAAGGLPSELARQAAPWRIDLTRLMRLNLDTVSTTIPYKRRQPVGEVNIQPADRVNGWQQTPKGVALRAREWWAAAHPSEDGRERARENIPEVLLSKGTGFAPEHRRPSFRLTLEPPAIDEFTLRRWVVPPIDAGQAQKDSIRERLVRALTNLHTHRGEDPFNPLSVVHDPAVSHLGLRVRVFDQDGELALSPHPTTIALNDSEEQISPYRRLPVPVSLEAIAFDADPALTAAPEQVTLALPAGMFACIEVWPLVRENPEFAQRFEDQSFFSGLIDLAAPFRGYVAFDASTLLCETAVDRERLPDARLLHQFLTLHDAGGAVEVSLNGPANIPGINFIDRFVLHRERWLWRNRPVLLFDELPKIGQDDSERRRLLASGLPATAFDEKTRDSDPGLQRWEDLAALDRGFVDRGDFSDRWARNPSSDARRAAGNATSAQLLLDDRDGSTSADYLRYGLSVTSRYVGILADQRPLPAKGEDPYDEHRRIYMSFRGGELKPLKILAVVPLTQSLDEDPVGIGAVPPFMLLLDETAFREYGAGERIDARLVLENQDIGERDDEPRPYRTGPLPDHWLPRHTDPQSPYFRRLKRTEEEDAAEPIELEVFGPFGYTLDQSPDEALANATALLCYPPADVGPHWASYVRFRRVVDVPESSLAAATSEWSGTHSLYTLPDAGRLVREKDRPNPRLQIRPDGNSFLARPVHLTFDFDPLSGANVAEDDKPGQIQLSESRKQARRNYLYFLLISREIAGAGRYDAFELPLQVLRISDFTTSEFRLRSLADGAADSHVQARLGRVLEVLVNGKYDGETRLDAANGLTDRGFWESLLGQLDDERDADGHDAAGMIRRVSQKFTIVWQ